MWILNKDRPIIRSLVTFPRALLPIAVLAVFVSTIPLSAVNANPDKQPEKDANPNLRLKEIERELNSLRSTEVQRREEQMRLAQEIFELKTALVETATRIQSLEDALFKAEQRLDELSAEEAIIAEEMAQERDRLYALLAAMQSLERQRPPALIVSPDDAVLAVRSAIIMEEILPVLKARTDHLIAQVKQLAELRTDIKTETEGITSSETSLLQEKTNIEYLLGKNADRQTALETKSSIDQKRIDELAKEASTLKSLINKLAREGSKNAVPSDPESDPKSTPGEDEIALRTPQLTDIPPNRDSNSGQKSRTNKHNLPPNMKFSQALGKIKLPVAGNVIVGYGESDDLGQKSEGITIATRANAQVVAPFDGTIAYAGPFLEFEQLLLIDTGEGYHIILTGMSSVFGSVGENLAAGEPIGVMGAEAEDEPEINEENKKTQPRMQRAKQQLYIEFRKNGDPINPNKWLVEDQRKASG